MLVGVALFLAALYVVNFTDWFKPRNIQISSRINPLNHSLTFFLDRPYLLTSIEVVSADEVKTNKYPHTLWHLVAKGSPQKTSIFSYGQPLPGMAPEVATAVPESLQPEIAYMITLEAGGDWKGQTNFTLR